MPDIVSPVREFRESLLAVLLYTDWLSRYGSQSVEAEFFPTRDEQQLVGWLGSYHSQYHNPPSEAETLDKFSDDGDVLELARHVFAVEGDDLRYARDHLVEFVQAQAMKLAILQSVDCIKAGDLQKPLELVREAQAVCTDHLELGRELVADADDWINDELHGRRFPTGWPDVDRALGGGLMAGEYGLVMAPPGRGKSTLLVNIGFAMAGLLGRANVLIVTLEMPEQKYLKRLAARVTGIRVQRGDSGNEDYVELLRERSRQVLRGRMRVVRPPGNKVGDIRRILDNLLGIGFKADALIVDYPDLMKSSTRRREFRFELAEVARDLVALGNEYKMPVWGGTQAGRQAINKEFIRVEDIAEAIEKAAIADVIISLCQTGDEGKLGVGRLFLAKVRDAEDKFAVPVDVDFESQTIVQRRVTDAKN